MKKYEVTGRIRKEVTTDLLDGKTHFVSVQDNLPGQSHIKIYSYSPEVHQYVHHH